MDFFFSVARFLLVGGFFLFSFLLVLVLGLASAVERFFYLRNVKKSNVQVWNRVLPLIQSGQYREAMSAANESDAAVSKILSYGLSRLNAARRRDDIETAMEEGRGGRGPRRGGRARGL